MGQVYRRRSVDVALDRALDIAGAVVLEGPRASGKTMTALNAAGSYIFIDEPEAQRALAISPRSILEGEAPRLLDEWQVTPELWNLVRRKVDASTDPGRFILTGSALPADDITRHTGAGRFLRLRQRTMSWWEKSGGVDSPVSIAGLFAGERPEADLDAGLDLDEIAGRILQPGFPAMTELEPDQSSARLRAYLDEVVRTDIHRLADVRHQPDVIRQLIVALARTVASEVTLKTLTADVKVVAPTINVDTIETYLGLMRRLFIVETQPPWAPTLRSRARLRRASKQHLADPSLAAALLGAGPEQLKTDLETLGLLFESAVTHDLMVFADVLGGEVLHYRDSNGREIDAVVALPDGRWGAVEVKLGGSQIPVALESLRRVVDQIDTETMGEPAFQLVVTGSGPILTAENGVVTAPLSRLAP